MSDLTTRLATPEDVPVLWQMRTFAASMEGAAEDVARARIDPELRGYVEGFGRAGDLGVVALREERPAGAAWLRLLVGDARPSKVWTDEVPELAIARDARRARRGGWSGVAARAHRGDGGKVSGDRALGSRRCNSTSASGSSRRSGAWSIALVVCRS